MQLVSLRYFAAFFLLAATVALAGGDSVVLSVVKNERGAVESVKIDGRSVFNGSSYARVTLFEKSPSKTTKRVFVDGRKIFEQSWDSSGRPLGAPMVLESPSGKSVSRQGGGGKTSASTGRVAQGKSMPPRPKVIVVRATPTATAVRSSRAPAPVPASGPASDLRKRAMSYEGVPYHRNGYSRKPGFNTAGLIWHFYNSLGLRVPRLLKDQAKAGKWIPRKQLRVGDALFFASRSRSRPNMGGIYLGGNEMIYMSYGKKRCRRVRIDTPYWNRNYFTARRILGAVPRGADSFESESRAGGSSSRSVASPPRRGADSPTGNNGSRQRRPLPPGTFFQQGYASYYGGDDGLHGSPTASGEIFDENNMTAAHKTLPFNTLVKVVRTDTGESVQVKINDRGPFVQGRIIDLSYGAARKLNILSKGVAKVNLYIVKYGDGRRK